MDTNLKTRVALCAVIFLVVIGIGLFSYLHNRQLGYMGGLAEEYFDLGVNLQQTGKFVTDSDMPFVFRPPGYVVFIAGVLSLVEKMHIHAEMSVEQGLHVAHHTVYACQSLLLALSASILFFWLSGHIGLISSFVMCLLFGTSPYLVILTGLLHYDVLHVFLVILSLAVSSTALEGEALHPFKLVVAGICWGITTLVRPTTLILAFFVFSIALIKFGRYYKKIAMVTGIFTLGMVISIAPYTIRNYRLTKRFIPVNAQAGFVLWAGTTKKLSMDPNHYKWWDIWYPGGEEVFYRIVSMGEPDNFRTLLQYNVELNEAFGKEAVKNILKNPSIYLHNFTINFCSFNLGINSVFIKLFQYVQKPGSQINKIWLKTGNPEDFYPDKEANAFKYFVYILTLLSLVGLLFALTKKDGFFLVPFFVYLCFAFAHSITYMGLMHYYIKLPFLFIFATYGIDSMHKYKMWLPALNKAIPADYVVAGILIIYGGLLTSRVIIGL